ncbi:MAG: flagellar basal-body rod protein FlgG [Acidobacteriota bacterium]
MQRALWTAASGMASQQLNVDTIANNLANVNTTGFKRSRAEFRDLLYQTVTAPGTSSSTTTVSPAGIQLGHGVRPAAVKKLFSQGEFKKTDNPLDLIVQGDGFFQVIQPDGTTAYTRDGALTSDRDGNLVNSEGFLLDPPITLPPDTLSITVGADGTVSVVQPGQTTATQVGNIELANFVNPSGLIALGGNLFQPSEASGDPITGTPGQDGLGSLAEGFLEISNVSIVNELVELIAAQRAYELNSRSVRAADEMLQQINQLVR